MARHEGSIVIGRPRSEVFAYMDDVSREREWQPYLLEATQTPEGPTQVGTKRRYVSRFLGKRIENTYVVVEYDPGRRVVVESTPDSTVRARNEIRWEDAGDERTRVTMAMEGSASGALRFVPRALVEATFEKEVAETLARLRDRLESASA